MLRLTCLLSFLCLFSISVIGQDASPFNSNVGVGFHLIQNQRDFGVGLNVTSPTFVHDKIAVRVRANLMWNQHLDGATTTWTPYGNFSLGVMSIGGYIGDFGRLYGEGGIVLLIPSDDFSSAGTEIGGYGLFGFEFFMGSMTSYFIEIGGIGTGAVADEVIGEPIYSNGMTISAGVRYTFK